VKSRPQGHLRTTGYHVLYPRLWNVAHDLKDRGDQNRVGSYHPYLAASVFAFFAFEGFVNEVGRLIASDAFRDERRLFGSNSTHVGTIGKFVYLAELVGLPIDTSCRPFQTVQRLADARDLLGHFKTEAFDVSGPVASPDGPPTPEIDKFAEAVFVDRALADVQELSDALALAAYDKFRREMSQRGPKAFTSGISASWSTTLSDKQRNQ